MRLSHRFRAFRPVFSPADETTATGDRTPDRTRGTPKATQRVRGPKQYSRSKLTVGILKLALAFVLLVVFLLSGASEGLRDLLGRWTDNYQVQLSYYVLALSAIYSLLFLGLDFYSDVVLERRYDLSSQTTGGWLLKSVKEFLLSGLFAVAVFNLLYGLIRHVPGRWWLVAAIGWFVIVVVVSTITPVLIVPLFYKTDPLKDRELADRLLALAGRCGVRVKRVFEIKLSKETKKANAAVVGLGRERRILIGDTLLNLCSHDEIEAVFAHELGHVALHHSWKLLAVGALSSLIAFYLLYLVLESSAVALGFEGAADIAAMPLLILWIAFFGLAAKPLQTAFSRHLERRADRFILDKVENPRTLASALAKLADRNLADPEPNRLVEILFYTHPPVAKRIDYILTAAKR